MNSQTYNSPTCSSPTYNSPTYKVEATHLTPQGHRYDVEKAKAGMTLKAAEMTAQKWAKAGYFTFVVDEASGECVAKAKPAEGD